MTNINYPLYGIDEEEITFNDVEKLIKKMNQNHLKIIRIKTDIINAIIDKKLGGNNQGWEPKEHEEFLKLKNSYNNRINTYEFLTALSTTIPYIPVSELKNHIYLYEKYIKINDIKKLLLNKYKEIKKKKDEEEKEKKIQKLKEEKKIREEQKKQIIEISSNEKLKEKKLIEVQSELDVVSNTYKNLERTNQALVNDYNDIINDFNLLKENILKDRKEEENINVENEKDVIKKVEGCEINWTDNEKNPTIKIIK